MNYKDILVYLDDGDSNEERVKAALMLAKSHDAHLTGVSLASVRPRHLKIDDEKAEIRISQVEAEKRTAEFVALAEAEGIDTDSRVISGNMGAAAQKLAQFCRNFDLVILRQANPNNRNFALIKEVTQEVILYSGRPIFFMPYIGAHRIPCQKAMIAWDGTPPATRAVHDALPLLRQIDEVIILVAQEGKQKTKKGQLLAQNLIKHLARHEVNAKVERVVTGTFDVPTVILNHIAENDVDLLVMGGYGTPNLKQKSLGGVTRTLLSSMLIPVFMSH